MLHSLQTAQVQQFGTYALVYQPGQKVLTVMKHIQFKNNSARMIQIAVAKFQLAARLPVNLLQLLHDINLSYTGALWLLKLTKFLQEYHLGILKPYT